MKKLADKVISEAQDKLYFEWEGIFKGKKIHAVFKVLSVGHKGEELPELELESVVDQDDQEVKLSPADKQALEDKAAEVYSDQ